MTISGTGFSTLKNSGEAAREAITMALKNFKGERPDLVIVFAALNYDYSSVLNTVREFSGTDKIVGCSTAGEFTEEKTMLDSIVVMALKSEDMVFEPVKVTDIKNKYDEKIPQALSGFKEQVRKMMYQGFENSCILALVDGLIGEGEKLVKTIGNSAGINCQIVGGAAGDYGKFTGTKVFFGTEVLNEGLVLIKIFSKKKMGFGLEHGMVDATEKMVVTKAEGSKIYEIDNKPAFEVYKSHAKNFHNVDLDDKNTSNYLVNNVLGVHVVGFTPKMRAPLSANDDGSINMASEVVKGCNVTIMSSIDEKLLEASRKASVQAKNSMQDKASAVIVFDCVCRQTILGSDFNKEIVEIKNIFGSDVPVIGFSTYGEIGKVGGALSGFHNSTIVIFAIP